MISYRRLRSSTMHFLVLQLAALVATFCVPAPLVSGFVPVIQSPHLFKKASLALPSQYDREHLANGLGEIHEETNDELKESEAAAAVDAHDLSDAGMEAAAEERAVIMAAALMHKLKQEKELKDME